MYGYGLHIKSFLGFSRKFFENSSGFSVNSGSSKLPHRIIDVSSNRHWLQACAILIMQRVY